MILLLFLSFILEPLNLLDRYYYLEKVFSFLLRGNPYLIQSNWILSFLYRQFNIDSYIPHLYV